MVFTSYQFVFIFLPIALLLYALAPTHQKNRLLAVISYFFYGIWDYRFCGLLFSITTLNYFIGNRIHDHAKKKVRLWLLVFSVAICVLVLGYFKYANFFTASLVAVFPQLPLSITTVLLPVGISFFTFQCMSYPIDIYRGNAQPTKRFSDFVCYISLFPQLIAGPIIRYQQIEKQLNNRLVKYEDICIGLRQFIVGFAKKVCIADPCGSIADTLFDQTEPSFHVAWVALLAYTLQIYFDFSGYSDMAIGLSRLLGFKFPQNFNSPYQAHSISNFWKRWHISLSEWFRDYVYLPLGGSRGRYSKTAFNLLITMLICGLWHGAAWNFVLWGAYYGILLLVEFPFREKINQFPKWITIPITTLLVMLGWLIFRIESMPGIIEWLSALMSFHQIFIVPEQMPSFLMVLLMSLLLVFCWIMPTDKHEYSNGNVAFDAVYLSLFIIALIVMMGTNTSPFLYFQF